MKGECLVKMSWKVRGRVKWSFLAAGRFVVPVFRFADGGAWESRSRESDGYVHQVIKGSNGLAANLRYVKNASDGPHRA